MSRQKHRDHLSNCSLLILCLNRIYLFGWLCLLVCAYRWSYDNGTVNCCWLIDSSFESFGSGCQTLVVTVEKLSTQQSANISLLGFLKFFCNADVLPAVFVLFFPSCFLDVLLKLENSDVYIALSIIC